MQIIVKTTVFEAQCSKIMKKNNGFCTLGTRVPIGTQDDNQTMRPLFGAANLNFRGMLLAAGLKYLGLRYPWRQPNDATPILSRKPEMQGNYY